MISCDEKRLSFFKLHVKRLLHFVKSKLSHRHIYVDSLRKLLFQNGPRGIEDSALILQKNFRSYSARVFLRRLKSSNYNMAERKQMLSLKVQNTYQNRRIQQRVDLIFRYSKISCLIHELIHFHVTKLNRFHHLCLKQMEKVKSNINDKEHEINLMQKYLSDESRKEDWVGYTKMIKFNRVSQTVLQRKLDKYNRQRSAICVQLAFVLELKKRLGTMQKNTEIRLTHLNERWYTVNSLVTFINSSLESNTCEEYIVSKINWLKQQRLKMMSCMSQYDTAQASILETQVDKFEFIKYLLMKSYNLIFHIIENHRLEVSLEGERAGLELIISTNECSEKRLSCIQRIKIIRKKGQYLKDTVATDAYEELEKCNQKFDDIIPNESVDVWSEKSYQQDFQYSFQKVPAISKEYWFSLYEKKPWIDDG